MTLQYLKLIRDDEQKLLSFRKQKQFTEVQNTGVQICFSLYQDDWTSHIFNCG